MAQLKPPTVPKRKTVPLAAMSRGVKLRDAEAALRTIRRRYWTIRRVGFAIAYHGALVFFILGPWVVVGVVLWQSGLFTPVRPDPSKTIPLRTPAPAATSVPDVSRWVVTEEQAVTWLRDALRSQPLIQQPQVAFRTGVAVLTATFAGPPPLPLEIRLAPRVSNGEVAYVLEGATVGAFPAGVAEALVQQLFVPTLTLQLSEFNRRFEFTRVVIGDQRLEVYGRVRAPH
ncbi:MAG: hypothetical protein PHI63_04205 [Patescibacteria group bacterium]|nr:hypothetical protein [Patescibacteria group bacterium]